MTKPTHLESAVLHKITGGWDGKKVSQAWKDSYHADAVKCSWSEAVDERIAQLGGPGNSLNLWCMKGAAERARNAADAAKRASDARGE